MCNEELVDDEVEEIENTDKCPECKTLTIVRSENRSYEYCETCGLITRASYDYAAGLKLDLPYGLLII
ncbi:hypothetical protein [uncultured Methanobrevibacter sp.]|uniref:hypothetical protein n=1 Tax=uncultured Methanobrevibacter sp. TaxID=253161 RepID=UPI0025D331CB|nr:hypothetical protein [uncultured Methanobrevibacter sp.]